MTGPVSNADLELFTDVAGSVGYGAYFQGKWSAGKRMAGKLDFGGLGKKPGIEHGTVSDCADG